MKKAKIIDGVVDVISLVAETDPAWIDVADNVFAGFVDDGEGGYEPPEIPELLASESAAEITLTRKQLRMGLVQAGKPADFVTALIDAMQAGPAKEAAIVNWEDTNAYHRNHPLVLSLGPATGFSEDEIDLLWISAKELDE